MAGFFREVLSRFDLREHGLHYYAWGLPDDKLMRLLSDSFEHTFISVDVCSFSERQRCELARRGLSKPFPTDEQILKFLAAADGLSNTTVMLNAIAGLPYQENGDHEEACSFITSALERRSLVELECLLLEWQPGALASDYPEEFGYVGAFKSFDEYVKYYRGTVDRPRLKFIDEEKNKRIEVELSEILELFGDRTSRSLRKLPVGDFFSLQDAKLGVRPYVTDFDTTRGKWLGDWLVDADKREERLHITRAAACGMEGSGYIEHAVDGERCLIYGNRSRALTSAYKSYSSELAKGILAEIRAPKTVREAFNSIRKKQKVSHAAFVDILAELSSYGFLNAD